MNLTTEQRTALALEMKDGDYILFGEQTPEDVRSKNLDAADAYAVVARRSADFGCILYGYFNGEWNANVWSPRWVIMHLLKDGRDLEEIRREVVEYVHDGGDFDWVLAVIEIRAWRAELAVLKESFRELRKCLLSTKRVDAEFKLTDQQMMRMRRIIRNAIAIGETDGEQATRLSADSETAAERQAESELQPDLQASATTATTSPGEACGECQARDPDEALRLCHGNELHCPGLQLWGDK